MAIFSSPEWSVLASITSSTNPHKIITTTFNPTCKTLHFFCLPCFSSSSASVSHVKYCSSCPSPILEEPSRTGFPVIQLDFRLENSEIYQIPSSDKLNDFLCGVLKDPKSEELGFGYYMKARERPEFRPGTLALKLLIRYLIRSEKWGFIFSVADDFKRYNVLPDGNTCATLVSGCVKARKFKIVDFLLEIFESVDRKIAVSALDSAMRWYNKLHMYGSTISVYEKMKLAGIGMDSGCYCQIMKAYHKLGVADRVVALYTEFESRKLDSNPIVLSQMLKILCDSLGKSGQAFEALEYFRDMRKKGILEDSSIYSSLICSFANIQEVNVAEELLKEAQEKKMLRDPEIFLRLVLMYIKEGLVENTVDTVKVMKNDAKLKVSDCVFCAIVNGFAKRRGFRAAVKVYEELENYGCEPGQVTYASVINAYCRLGLHSKAEMVFSEMERKGFDKCVVAYSSIISMYGKNGRLRDAMRLVAKMKLKRCEPNVWIYNSLLDMHGRAKNLRQVEKLWKEMKRRKVAPDKVTYTSLISAYNKSKEYETCVRFYDEYRLNGGAIDGAIAGIMVGVFSKISRIDELVKLLRDMKSQGTPLDERLYKSASNALRDAGLDMQAKWLQDSFQAI